MNKIYTVKRNRYLLRTSMINLNKKKQTHSQGKVGL